MGALFCQDSEPVHPHGGGMTTPLGVGVVVVGRWGCSTKKP